MQKGLRALLNKAILTKLLWFCCHCLLLFILGSRAVAPFCYCSMIVFLWVLFLLFIFMVVLFVFVYFVWFFVWFYFGFFLQELCGFF